MCPGKFKAFNKVVFLFHAEPCDSVVGHGVGIAVNLAFPCAEIVGNGNRRRDFYLFNIPSEIDMADLADIGFHHLVGKAALQIIIVLFLHLKPWFYRDKRRDGKLCIALRRTGRIGIIQADRGDVVIRLGKVGVICPDFVGVHRFAGEGGIILHSVLFRRTLENHHHGNRRHGKPAAVHHFDGSGRDLAERLDHLGIDLVRIRAGYHIVTGNLITAPGAHTRHLAVFDKDLFHFLIELILRTVLFAFGLQLHAHFVRKASADIRAGEIVRHQESIDGKGQIVHPVADVDPVRRQHLNNLLRELVGGHHFRCAVADGFDKIRMLQQHLHLAHRIDGEVVHTVINPAAELHEVQHFFIHTGYLGINFPGHGLISVMQGDVDTGIRQNGPVAFRHREPVNIHAHIIKELADFQPCSRFADRHHFMERRFDFKPVPHIVRCEAARHVVLFKDQDILNAPRLELQTGRHACQCTAYNDHLIMVFIKTHGLYSFLNKFQGAVRRNGTQSLITENQNNQKNLSTSSREYSAVSSMSPKDMISPA